MSDNTPGEPFVRVDPKAAKQRIDSGELTVVDVREPAEYQRDHIPGAKLIPLGQIIARPAELLAGQSVGDNVLFVCEVGQRSGVAAELAASAGMEHPFNLDGGMQAWRAAGLATER